MTLAARGNSQKQAAVAYSFDVFDTCLTRTFAFPRDLFFELGLQLAPSSLSPTAHARFAAKFQRRRIRAEKRARRQADGSGEVTIHDIYGCFVPPKGLSATLAGLVEAEIKLERKSLFAVPAMVSRLQALRSAGHRIIFISDMYLPSSILGPFLKERGIMEGADALYVSCDIGLSKHNGALFQHVLKTERLEPSQLIHTGDNPHSDVTMAARLRIRPTMFSAASLNLSERKLAGNRLPRVPARTLLAGLIRRLRLSTPTTLASEANTNEVICVIVPLLLAYVMWVLAQARRDGIRRLYFVARDAEVLLHIARTLECDRDEIELRYLHGSRRAWLVPSVDPRNDSLRRLLIVPGQANSRADITGRLGLNGSQQEIVRAALACAPETWHTEMTRSKAETFLAELLAGPGTANVIAKHVERERENALAYLRQERLLDGTPWALVDAGWSLNSQAALKRILDTAKSNHPPIRGYYLGLTRDRLGEDKAGLAVSFVVKVGSLFSRRRVVIEHCFLPSTHSTTVGYEQGASRTNPILGPELRSDKELNYARTLHELAVTAAKVVATDPHFAADLAKCTNEIVANAEHLLRHPSKVWAQNMSALGTIADLRHEQVFVVPLCSRLHIKDVWTVIGMTLSKGKNFKSPSFMWLEGSTALSPWYVRLPMHLLLTGDSALNRLKDAN